MLNKILQTKRIINFGTIIKPINLTSRILQMKAAVMKMKIKKIVDEEVTTEEMIVDQVMI